MSIEVNVVTVKDQLKSILDRLPDDATLEDVQYQIYVLQKVNRGLREADAGDSMSQEDFERRIQRWIVE